jgi:endonuclease YncB( thermonuclease family)
MLARIKGWIWGKPIGFDWHQYVQTTIKLKRQQRRERVVNAGQAAVDQAQAAAQKVAAGSLAAGVAAKDGAVAAAKSAGDLAAASLQQTPAALAAVLTPAGRLTGKIMRPLIDVLSRPAVAGPLAVAGIIALISGISQAIQSNAIVHAWLPIAVGCLLLAISIPPLALRLGFNPGHTFRLKVPSAPALGLRPTLGIAAAAVVVGTLGYFAMQSAPPLVSAVSTTNAPVLVQKQVLEGRRIQAVTGDTLKIEGQLVRLSGVEAPDLQQVCTRGAAKRWKCGEAAKAAMERLVRGKTVTCTLSGSEGAGRALATCVADGRDVAADLLKDGHIFSSSGYFGAYASLEAEAKRGKVGLWAGDAERPADYRSRLWEAAAKVAPEGCPIKGRVSSGSKTFVMPWDSNYASATVRPTRGDRWFCNEKDAMSAGFKVADRN